MKEQYNLTKKEEELLELMWEYNKPLTSVEMLELYKENPCKNHTYIHRMINSLLKKKLIRVCGTVQYKTQYARQFETTLTKEEYMEKILLEKGFKKSMVAKVAIAMVQKIDDDDINEELIQQLEKVIEDLRNKKE